MRRLTTIKNLLQRNIVKLVVATILTAILSVLAITPGVGYGADAEITSSELLMRGHRCFGVYRVPDCEHSGGSSCWCILGWLDKGVLNITYNPCLFPVNHLLSTETSSNFTFLTKSWVSKMSVKESLITQTILTELLLNVPILYIASLILAIGFEKALVTVGWGKRFGRPADSLQSL